MNDARRIALIACLLLVILRLAIGWQLLYEGLWKIKTLKTPTPWSAAGYLKNSQGPLRDHFRDMAGDPNDLDWLDPEKVSAKWDDWQNRFTRHYRLDDRQASTLNRWINGSKEFAAELDALPETVDLKALRLDSVVRYDPEKKRLLADGKKHLLPAEREKLLGAVDPGSPEWPAYKEAVTKLFLRSKNGLSFKERLAGKVAGNPDLREDKKAQQLGEKKIYTTMLEQYEAKLQAAKQDFEWDHLSYAWGKIQAKRAELVNPVKALDQELKEKAEGLLTLEQLGLGPAPKPWTTLRISDTMTIAGLTILGSMLLLGLWTRFAAIMAAVMLFMFYMAMPPLPGLPEAPGPEHSFIVNKNLIEVLALLAIAALPTGRWFGADGMLGRWWGLRKAKKRAAKQAAPATQAA